MRRDQHENWFLRMKARSGHSLDLGMAAEREEGYAKVFEE